MFNNFIKLKAVATERVRSITLSFSNVRRRITRIKYNMEVYIYNIVLFTVHSNVCFSLYTKNSCRVKAMEKKKSLDTILYILAIVEGRKKHARLK